MNCDFPEITGVKTIAFYVDKGVSMNRPDPSVEDEVDLIAHGVGSVVVDVTESPKWQRGIDHSENYGEIYKDTFLFNMYGTTQETRDTIKFFRENKAYGFITELILLDGRSFVFPTPVFVSIPTEKKANQRGWFLEMTYKVPTKQDYLTKLNTLLATQSYILVGNNLILGYGSGAIVSN